ncbi:hypothetical protein BLNAU_7765 [Blattamonas nauphoetae]|uniref:Uncharacterized protein n=1 Tax=Blattamonas nauphoetae TaxID=2049346 RepID=A0ABQ9Y0C5_9EUKA|nr:hypothetical protein BLNAU_7765 [Blattamonas nauphoetae]
MLSEDSLLSLHATLSSKHRSFNYRSSIELSEASFLTSPGGVSGSLLFSPVLEHPLNPTQYEACHHLILSMIDSIRNGSYLTTIQLITQFLFLLSHDESSQTISYASFIPLFRPPKFQITKQKQPLTSKFSEHDLKLITAGRSGIYLTDDDYESRLSDFSPKLAIPQPMHFQPQDLAVLRGHSPSSMDGSEVELVDASDQPPPTSIFGHSGIHQLQHSSTASTSLPTLMSPDGLLAQLHTIFALPQQYLFFPKLFSVGSAGTSTFSVSLHLQKTQDAPPFHPPSVYVPLPPITQDTKFFPPSFVSVRTLLSEYSTASPSPPTRTSITSSSSIKSPSLPKSGPFRPPPLSTSPVTPLPTPVDPRSRAHSQASTTKPLIIASPGTPVPFLGLSLAQLIVACNKSTRLTSPDVNSTKSAPMMPGAFRNHLLTALYNQVLAALSMKTSPTHFLSTTAYLLNTCLFLFSITCLVSDTSPSLSAQSSFGSERRASLFGGPSRAPPLSTLYKQPLQYLISLLLHHIALFLFNRFLLPFATHKVVESLDLTVSQTMPSKKLTVNPRSDSLSTGSQFLTRSPSLTSLLSATSSSLLFPTSDLYFNPVPPSTPATKAVPVMKLQSSVKPPPPSRSHSFSRSASSKKEVPQSKAQIPFTSVSSTPVPQPHLQPSPSPSPLPSPIQSNAFANVQASTTSSVNVHCFITRLEMIDDDDISTGMSMDDLVFPSTRQNGHKKIRLEELLGALSEAQELLQSQTTQPSDPDDDHFESPNPTCTLFPPAAVDAIMCELLLIFSTKLTEALLQPPFGFSMTRGFQLHLFVSELIDWAAKNLTHVQPFGAYATNRELSTIDPFIAVVRTDNGETVTPIPHQPYPIVSSSLPALFSSLAELSFILLSKPSQFTSVSSRALVTPSFSLEAILHVFTRFSVCHFNKTLPDHATIQMLTSEKVVADRARGRKSDRDRAMADMMQTLSDCPRAEEVVVDETDPELKLVLQQLGEDTGIFKSPRRSYDDEEKPVVHPPRDAQSMPEMSMHTTSSSVQKMKVGTYLSSSNRSHSIRAETRQLLTVIEADSEGHTVNQQLMDVSTRLYEEMMDRAGSTNLNISIPVTPISSILGKTTQRFFNDSSYKLHVTIVNPYNQPDSQIVLQTLLSQLSYSSFG